MSALVVLPGFLSSSLAPCCVLASSLHLFFAGYPALLHIVVFGDRGGMMGTGSTFLVPTDGLRGGKSPARKSTVGGSWARVHCAKTLHNVPSGCVVSSSSILTASQYLFVTARDMAVCNTYRRDQGGTKYPPPPGSHWDRTNPTASSTHGQARLSTSGAH
jgi:hypothetical protein